MNYTIKERNAAILQIAGGAADLSNVTMLENLDSFQWITVSRSGSIINNVELTYTGKDLSKRLFY